jgi:hypothetical protein
MTPAGAQWELDALARLAKARDITELILAGHLEAHPAVVESLSQLVQSAATSLYRRDRIERKAA